LLLLVVFVWISVVQYWSENVRLLERVLEATLVRQSWLAVWKLLLNLKSTLVDQIMAKYVRHKKI